MTIKSMVPFLKRDLLVLAVIVAGVGSAMQATAAPAEIFVPYLDRIRQSLPPGWAMRLPSQVLLSEPADFGFVNQLDVRVYGSSTPATLNVSLFSCENGPYPCLVGSFSADSQTSVNALRDFAQHQQTGTVFTLTPGVQGYLVEGRQRPTPFSSLMWQQDGMIYTVSFLSVERDNIVDMAASMAREAPIYRAVAPQQAVPFLPF